MAEVCTEAYANLAATITLFLGIHLVLITITGTLWRI